MDATTRKRAIEVINQELKRYQPQIMHHIELKAEYDLQNGNSKCDVSKELNECYLKRCQLIIADLLSVKRALQNNKDEVKLYASQPEGDPFYCDAIWTVLLKTGLDFFGDVFDDIVRMRDKAWLNNEEF